MKRFFTSAFGIALLVLASCATTDPVTQADIDTADFGAYPENYEALIKDYLFHSLIDPNSMMVEFTGKPYKGFCPNEEIVPRGQHFGYGVILRVNAKNRLGGYVGWKGHVAYIRNGVVYRVTETAEELGPEFGPERYVRPIAQLVPKDRKR